MLKSFKRRVAASNNLTASTQPSPSRDSQEVSQEGAEAIQQSYTAAAPTRSYTTLPTVSTPSCPKFFAKNSANMREILPALRRLGWQTWVLIKMFVSEKKGAWQETLLNLVFPLYPVLFLLLLIELDFLPFQKTDIQAVPFLPPFPLETLSNVSILQWQANPQLLGFGPASDERAMRIAGNVTAALGIPLANTTLLNTFDDMVNAWKLSLSAAVYIDGDDITIAHQPIVGVTNFFNLQFSDRQFTPQEAFFGMGVVYLQTLVNEAALADKGVGLSQTIFLQSLPIPEEVKLENFLSFIFPILLLGSLFFSMRTLLIEVSLQAERGFRQSLMLKGLDRTAIWISAFLTHGGFTCLVALLLTGALYAVQILKFTAVGDALGVFLLNALAQTSFGVLVLSLVGDGVNSKTVFGLGVAAFVLFQVVFFAVEFGLIPNVTDRSVIAACFLIYVAPFGHILFNVPTGELLETGVSDDLDPTISLAYTMLGVDIVLYLVLAILYDWFRTWRSLRKVQSLNAGDTAQVSAEKKVSGGGGIIIQDLLVQFKKSGGGMCRRAEKFNAVDRLSLEVSENEIFCLLGHNGAGKTTTFNVLVGTLLPTSGDAWVHGYHIVKDRDELRQNIGVCPQHDIVLDNISCLDQLTAQAQITGMDYEPAKEEALELLDKLDLLWKRHEKPKNLSGGQKRRLTLALALIGRPKIIILDEPTTGLDPNIRRVIWGLLNELKKDHTVLMTTHSLEEADALADRMAIMSEGKIEDIGTSLELKERHGPGYKLHCVKIDQNEEVLEALERTVQRHVPGAKHDAEQSAGAELSFILPLDQTAAFPALFDDLEQNAQGLGLASFGLTPSTLEDVFLKLDNQQVTTIRVEQAGGDVLEVDIPLDSSVGQLKEAIFDKIGVETGKQTLTFEKSKLDDETMELKDYGLRSKAKVKLAVKEAGEKAKDHEALAVAFREDNVYNKVLSQQFGAVFRQVITVMRRNPVTWFLVIFYPVLLTIGFNYLFDYLASLSEPIPPVTISLQSLFDAPVFPFEVVAGDEPLANSILSPFGDGSPISQPLYDEIQNQSLSGGYQFNAIGEVTSDYVLVLNLIYDRGPGVSSGLFAVGQFAERWYLGSAMMQQLYDGIATNASVTSNKVVYWEWESAISTNSLFGGGAASYIVALVLGIQSAIICVEMMFIRISRTKELLLLSGMPRWLFWACYFLAHSLVLMVPCFTVYLVLFLFSAGGTATSSFFAFFFLFIFYICCGVTIGYLLSYLFNDEEAAQNFSAEFVNLTLTVPWAVITFASATAPPDEIENTLSFFIPAYGLYRGLALLQTAETNQEPFDFEDIWDWDRGLAQTYLMLFLSFLFYGSILMVIDSGIITRIIVARNNRIVKQAGAGKVEEEELSKETEVNIKSVMDGILPPPISAMPHGEAEENIKIQCNDIYKSFVLPDKTVFPAVKKASLGVVKHSIFGLLGPNGAGKTTLIKCMTGLEGYVMDSGTAQIFGYNTVTERAKVLPIMGICPQHDVLINLLTGRELLTMFARIRGVPAEHVPDLVTYYLKMLDLTPKADSLCKTYSGGNKRRLSVALSMIGSPSAIFMDEPSTGLDPATRRKLWEFLLEATRTDQDRDRCILLTTHSMEEADALCSRIAIMVSGSVRTVGTSQELKNRYGTDRIVVVGVSKSTRDEDIDELMAEIHPGSLRLKESTVSSKKYSVPTEGTPWSRIFKVLQSNQEKYDIEHFSVSQRSLEDVFIDFANLNLTDDEKEKNLKRQKSKKDD